MAVTRNQALAELARRELERRQASVETTPDPVAPASRLRGMAGGEKLSPLGGLKAMGGAAESALTGVTGYLSNIPAGLAGLLYGAAPGGASGTDAIDAIREALTYRPRLPEGQAIGESLGKAMQPIAQAGTDVLETPYPLLSTALKTGVQGALELGVGGGGGAAVSRMVPKPKPGEFIPGIKDLYAAGRVAFNEARLNGGGIRSEAIGRLRNGVSEFRNEAGVRIGFNEKLHPQAAALQDEVIRAIDEGGIDFDRLLELREMAGGVAGNADPAIAMRGVLIKNQIDEFVDSLKPGDVLSGDPGRAARSLETARALWRDASKARTIEEQIELAGNRAGQFSGSGYENALRTQFRQLNARIIKGQEKGWTKAERDAIARVANGGKLDNVWRALGKLAPTGVVSGGIGAGIGYTAFGPLGAAVVPGAGAIGRLAATKGTVGNAQKALNLPLMRSVYKDL